MFWILVFDLLINNLENISPKRVIIPLEIFDEKESRKS